MEERNASQRRKVGVIYSEQGNLFLYCILHNKLFFCNLHSMYRCHPVSTLPNDDLRHSICNSCEIAFQLSSQPYTLGTTELENAINKVKITQSCRLVDTVTMLSSWERYSMFLSNDGRLKFVHVVNYQKLIPVPFCNNFNFWWEREEKSLHVWERYFEVQLKQSTIEIGFIER